MTSPAGLGTAQGRITIDVAGLQRIQALSRQIGQQVAQNLGQIDAGAKRAELSLKSLAATFGVAFGARQLAQFAIHADEVATAYARQSVAAVSLAGSQEKLTALMESYDKATGRAIDKAGLLAQVTQLQAIGFADNTAEIERFATAVRGISLAKGMPQDYIQQELQLAIANQSERRLDQIGIGIDELRAKKAQLKAADSSLTDAQIYQNAIFDVAIAKYGALAKSAAGQATGLEKARKAWANLTLETGQAFGPALGTMLTSFANELDKLAARIERAARLAAAARREIDKASGGGGGGDGWITDSFWPGARMFWEWEDPITAWARGVDEGLAPPTGKIGGGGGRGRGRGAGTTAENLGQQEDQLAAKLAFESTIQDIERQAASQRLSATRQYEQQRTDTIRQYEQTIARDAEDFGRQRARAEAQFAKQIADVQADAAKREADMAEDLAGRIADAQEATAERINDIEDNYRRNRERAERTHRDNLMDAAARLDATAVFNEQKRFARESEEAKTAHDDQIGKEQENLAERLQQEQESHAERLQDAREADTERLQDMQEAFAETKRLEDEDRAIRLARMAEDQAEQLASMDAAHAAQMAEIAQQEADERKAAEEAHLKELEAAGLFNKAWKQIQDQRQREALESWDRWWQGFNGRLVAQGAMTPAQLQQNQWNGANLTSPVPLTSPPSARGGDTRILNVQAGAISVYAAPGQSAEAIASTIDEHLVRRFRELAN